MAGKSISPRRTRGERGSARAFRPAPPEPGRTNARIPRASDEWKRLNRRRSAVEREFGNLKHNFGLATLRVRGLARVALHADLCILARLGRPYRSRCESSRQQEPMNREGRTRPMSKARIRDAPFRVSFPGPFTRHEVVVDGWSVPHLHAHPTGDHDESVMLVIDNRLAMTVSVEEAERFVPFLADAVAVALGYTAHPRGDEEQPNRLPQPRPVRMHGIGAVESDDAAQ
jgi:Transposase DDE domain